jgi:hypothetical protein
VLPTPPPSPPAWEPTPSHPAWEAPPGLPKIVSGFAFSSPATEAERVCAGTDRLWEQQGVNADCKPKVDGGGETARLEFELGSMTKITIVHAPAENLFNKSYDSLHAKLKARYGRPQVWRDSPSGDCAAALPECFKRGQTFSGSAWAFSTGRLELAPVWRDQRAFIEERYIQERAPTK